MRIQELPIPENLKTHLEKDGITELYPPQTDCVKAGLFEGNNLTISIPTASGKTLVAEIAMHATAAKGGRSLYIVPLRALASEKYGEFSGKDLKVGIATGDLDRRDEYLGRNDIIIATSEKVDSLLRNTAPWLQEITLLVVDEAHLIDSEHRDATLEMVITKLRALNPTMQIIALTATVGNPEVLAGWLNAKTITSDWRPVDLREGIYLKGKLYFNDDEIPIAQTDKNDDTNLCLDTVEHGGQCLVFVSSRKNAEGFAKRCAKALSCDNPELDAIADELKKVAETEMGQTLAACVRRGAAFHHAGMKRQQRHLVEQGFRDRHIKVISSTPTLAAGLNLPARRVIIRDYLRFKAGEGMVPIPVREYRQMAGRAGRPRLDPSGEAVLIAKSKEQIEGLFSEYIEAPAEDVSSRLDSEDMLTGHVLSLIATNFVKSEEDLISFLEKTFYVWLSKESEYLGTVVQRSLEFLFSAGMVTELNGRLAATNYGSLVSCLYIHPHSAEIITTMMEEHSSAKSFSSVGLVHLLCTTPDMRTLYVKKNDLGVLEKYFFEHEEEIWAQCRYDEMEDFYRSLKTAMLLDDWMGEKGEDTICSRYGIGPGDIYNVVDGINWLLHSAVRLAGLAAPDIREQVTETALQVRHGVKANLIPLVKLKGIGRVRARRLFDNGITSPDAIRTAGISKISRIIGRKTAENIFRELEGRDSAGQKGTAGESGYRHMKRKKKSETEFSSDITDESEDEDKTKKRSGQVSLFEF